MVKPELDKLVESKQQQGQKRVNVQRKEKKTEPNIQIYWD